jgi:ribosome-associated protein
MAKKQILPAEQLRDFVVQGMLERKAADIVILDLRSVKNAITDFFVICSGNSDTQIEAIADSVEEEIKKNLNERCWHREGRQVREWVLIDYVNVVVHVFRKDRREFYDLENLWGDAVITKIKESFDERIILA